VSCRQTRRNWCSTQWWSPSRWWQRECLWGTASDDVWRRVLQLVYVDDWAGSFENKAQLCKAWKVWRVWEPLAGAAIGVKQKLKTVVTGIVHADRKCKHADDPKLRTLGGTLVPFMQYDEAYKHLGKRPTNT
jgi:hypothetical protein